MEVTTAANAAASERWERDYSLIREGIQKARTDEEIKVMDAKVKRLEADLAGIADDGTLAHKRRRLADLIRSLLLRQSQNSGVGAVTSFSSTARSEGERQSLESMLEEQREASRTVDRRLGGVQRDVGEVHAIATTMNQTIELQRPLLDDIEEGMHGLTSAVEIDTRRVRDVAKASDTRSLRCTIFALVGIFVLMLILKVS